MSQESSPASVTIRVFSSSSPGDRPAEAGFAALGRAQHVVFNQSFPGTRALVARGFRKKLLMG